MSFVRKLNGFLKDAYYKNHLLKNVTYLLVLYTVRPLRITCGTVIVDGTELRSFFPIGRNRWKNSSLLDFKETLETIFPTKNPSTISVHFVFAKNGGRSNYFVWIDPERLW